MRRGFTLIELSIALAIAAVLFAAVIVSVGALTGMRAKEAAGELGGVIRWLSDTAALSGRTCRLVFELPARDDDDAPVKYRAECASGARTAARDRDEELREVRREQEQAAKESKRGGDQRRFRTLDSVGSSDLQSLLAVEKDRVEKQATYAEFTDPEVPIRPIPNAVRVSVWTRHQRAPVSTGTAFLYFFPQGYTERAMIWVRQGSNVWTLEVSPLTGKTRVVAEDLEVPRS